MFSYEIDRIMKERSYYIDSETYLRICGSSPQIKQVSYHQDDNSFEIRTDEGRNWKFGVYRKDGQ